MSDVPFQQMNAGLPALGDVMVAAAAAGGHALDGEAHQAAARLRLPEVRTWCVVVVDGLGWHNLAARPEYAPFLTATLAAQETPDSPRRRLAATLPSSTPTNLAYLGTGQRPGRTSMLGYTVRNPATGGLLNLISWNGGADPHDWQPAQTVFERFAPDRRAAVSVGPWQFEGSGLTLAALRGAEYHPAQSLPERVDASLGALRDPDVGLVYLYWGDLDAAGHRYGWRSAEWAEQLQHVDEHLRRLARLLPQGTGMLITADHGMIDVPDGQLSGMQGRIDAGTHPQLSRDVDLLGGEDRFRHVYTEYPEQVARRWREVLGERATVLTRQEAIQAGTFGPVTAQARPIIGDVIAAAQGQVAIQDSVQQSPAALALRGMHGSTTETEVEVPLAVVTG
ncbi:MAG TPA: alkaline phosphatase family protein [Beutenbergiaceae bacterium]|nr:alkaline phosphatase family protein [Beutenbergiaceae bacterium]